MQTLIFLNEGRKNGRHGGYGLSMSGRELESFNTFTESCGHESAAWRGNMESSGSLALFDKGSVSEMSELLLCVLLIDRKLMIWSVAVDREATERPR